MRKKIIWYIFDCVMIMALFYLLNLVKFGSFQRQWLGLSSVYILILWTGVSIITKKIRILNKRKLRDIVADITISNVFMLGSVILLGRLRPRFMEIRFLLVYLVFIGSLLEFLVGVVIAHINRVNNGPFEPEQEDQTEKRSRISPGTETGGSDPAQAEPDDHFRKSVGNLERILSEETDRDVIEFLEKYILTAIRGVSVVSTTTRFNIINLPAEKYDLIINLKRLNDIQYLNKFFEAVNSKINTGGMFIGWFESYSLRKKRILAKYPRFISHIVYFFDYLVKRVFPKLSVTKKIYFFLTRGQNRVLSIAETYGRLYSCGFEISEEIQIGGKQFFVVSKVQMPCFDANPTYGPLIRLKRVGQSGRIISVYKFRTMHAYSEYLQGYIYDRNNLQMGGKFKDDFRVTTIGRVFRKLWLDELPMMVNLLMGDLKIVGVRPLSQHYFDLYSEELKEKRLQHKPGLIPPFYVDLPKTLSEIMDSEMRYLKSYEKNPTLTDIRYFCKAFWNIAIKRARSK